MTGRPDPHPKARGALGAWVSGAMMWSATTKRLLESPQPGEQMLAMVAFYLCLKETCLLIEGKPDVPHDAEARDSCPVPPRQLRRLRDRLQGFRDEVMHLSDKSLDDHRVIQTKWSADEPHFTYESSVGRDHVGWDKMTRDEVQDVLGRLDPWLHDCWERITSERDPVADDALRAKIDAVMSALAEELREDAQEPDDSGANPPSEATT